MFKQAVPCYSRIFRDIFHLIAPHGEPIKNHTRRKERNPIKNRNPIKYGNLVGFTV